MSFVGIICDSKCENYVRQSLKQKLKDDNVIIFSNESIENLKNIKFEMIIIMSQKNNLIKKSEILKNIIAKTKYLIVNADEEIDFSILSNMNLNVITYGFNSKSTITISSVKDESIMLCIQRTIIDCKENEIEPQEISIQKNITKMPTNIAIGLATVLLLKGIKNIEV